MKNFIAAAGYGWLVYFLASLVVLFSITTCVLILYLISTRSNSVEKAKTKLPETESDKKSKFGTDPLSINKNKIQVIEDQNKNGFVVKIKGNKKSVAFAKTKEEAQEIASNISKQESSSEASSSIEVTNRRGVDGEMVSYTNDKSL